MKNHLSRRQFLQYGASGIAAGLLAPYAAAQSGWPTKAITIVVPAPPGGTSDTLARILANQIKGRTGATVLVDNKAGAAGSIGLQAMLAAPSDGYAFAMTNSFAVNQIRVMIKSLPYDPDADLTCVAAVGTGGLQLAVKKECPANSLAELIELGKTGQITLGSFASGSYNHMFVHQVNKLYGTRMNVVHYKGEAPMWMDVAGGHIDGAIGSYGTYKPFLDRGQLRPIGIGGSVRLPNLPDMQTFSEQGFTDDIFLLEAGWIGLMASSKIPAVARDRMSAEFVKTFSQGEGREQLLNRGLIGKVLPVVEFTEWQRVNGPKWIAMASELGLAPQ